jgi:MFS family permease
MSSGGAVISGIILAAGTAPEYFALCFFLAAIATIISFSFLTRVREEETMLENQSIRTRGEFWHGIRQILRRDANFRSYIAARSIAQFASIGPAFFTVYAVRRFTMDPGTAGIMTGILLLAQVVASPFIGWLGDRFSHRLMYAVGALLAGASTSLALFAPSLDWFYLVFALAGLANAGMMTPIYALAVEFGAPAERPYYIGLASTLTAPAALIAPILGGWLADSYGYGATFALAAGTALLTASVLVLIVREPRQRAVELATA